MELEYSKKEKITGLFIIVVIALMIALVLIVGRGKSWFKSYVTYYAAFDESYNLKVNSDIKLFKADIGKIKKITPSDNRVKIELAILKDFASRIRTGSVVTVESPTFIGSEYISLYPGSSREHLIPEKGMIPSKEKKSISDFLAEFEVEKTAKMLVKTIQDFSNVADSLQRPSGPLFSAIQEFSNTFANLAKITENINKGNGTVGELLNSKKTIEEIDEVVASLKVVALNLEKGSSDVPKITDSTIRGISELREKADNIDRIVKSLEKNFLIKRNLPKETKGINIDAGLRQ